MIGDPEFYLYDDHTPPADPDGRGWNYRHIPFTFNRFATPRELTADCDVPARGHFALTLKAGDDHVDIGLHVTNHLSRPMGPIDWAFCVIALESPQLRDPEHARTFIFDGRELRSFRELRVGSGMTLIRIDGGDGFGPEVHKHLPRSKTAAKQSVTILESSDGKHSAAIGFEQSYSAFGCTGNMCFHADPYFGVIEAGKKKSLRGRLYLIDGDRHEALRRYQDEFVASSHSR